MENERHHTYTMMSLQYDEPDLLTDEVIVRLGPEPGVAAVEEGGAEGEGGAGLGQGPGVGPPHHPAPPPGQGGHHVVVGEVGRGVTRLEDQEAPAFWQRKQGGVPL